MGLDDVVREEFRHLSAGAVADEAAIRAVEAALERMPEAESAVVLAALTLTTREKRRGAELIAAAERIIAIAAPVFPFR